MAKKINGEGLQTQIIKDFTSIGEYTVSSGGVRPSYVDCRAAMLSGMASTIAEYLAQEIPNNCMVIGTGAGGAMMLALLPSSFSKILWNPKNHGKEWSSGAQAQYSRAWLVDDVMTTGETMARMKEAVETKLGLDVIGQTILVDRRIIPEGKLIYLSSPYWDESEAHAESIRDQVREALTLLTGGGFVAVGPFDSVISDGTRNGRTWSFWSSINLRILDACDELWALEILGRLTSEGELSERNYALSLQKPVRFMRVYTNHMGLRAFDVSPVESKS